MIPLEKQLRSKLENTVKEARDIAEAGAVAALQQLGVGLKEADAHLSEAEKDLRRRLRAHGRQLGDARRPEGTQDVICLMEEVAYEHWHRMLFARFLAENDLLMYPDPDEPVAVSLEECEEMAADEGARNGWELAARYASKMLPQIFRPDSPSFELELPPEYQRKLENLLAGLAVEVFQASDALGWVYQFWQAKRKDEVNASEVKIGARELPAVTQLFTEPYMVSFLLDNSLGAWWAARRLTPKDYEEVSTEYTESTDIERELRKRASLPGVPLEYLRFVNVESTKDTKGTNKEDETNASNVRDFGAFRGQSTSVDWVPAAGTFDGWPEKLAELKTLDPCCGSGHFLVAAFLMLVPMRMELEGLSAREAVDAVLRENLHGLEIDPRCVEIAAFALAVTAWRFPDAGGYRPLPELQLACSGLSISVAKEEWKALPLEGKTLRSAMDMLYDTFAQAPVLGSLIDPLKSYESYLVDWPVLQQTLSDSLNSEQPETQRELGIVAQGLTKAAQLLSSRYHYVMTNVPYLARGKQSEVLKDFCERQYPAGKNDLATVFLDRCLQFCHEGGSTNVVLPQNWLFLGSYKKFREKLLRSDTWNLVARMGPGAFETISGEVVKAILLTLSRGVLGGGEGVMGRKGEDLFSPALPLTHSPIHQLRGLDVSEPRTARAKAEQLLTTEIKSVSQAGQLENPDARVAFEEVSGELLEDYAECFAGVLNGDSPRFQKKFWEIFDRGVLWTYQQTTVDCPCSYGGLQLVLYYDKENGHLREEKWIRRDRLHDSDQRGNKAWGKKGVGISQMRILPSSIYTGETFDSNIAVIYPENQKILVLRSGASGSSPEYNEAGAADRPSAQSHQRDAGQSPLRPRTLDQSRRRKIPERPAEAVFGDPTQWIFHGHPVGNDDPLQVAVARLLVTNGLSTINLRTGPRTTQKARKKSLN